MRISSPFVLVCLFLAIGASLTAQTAVEYGTIAAGSTTSATTDAKKISKSIGGVFGQLGKALETPSKGQQGHQTAASAAAAKRAASSRGKQPAALSAAKPESSSGVQSSQIQIGMSRTELLSAVGKPNMQIGGTDEGVFVETYMYGGSADTVTVTLRDGKVTGISPMPQKSITAPASATPTQTSAAAERQR